MKDNQLRECNEKIAHFHRTVAQLQDKSHYLFVQLQTRDQEFNLYTEKMDAYLVLERKTTAKLLTAQQDAVHFKEKFEKVDE